MTVSEKRDRLDTFCRRSDGCSVCKLSKPCKRVSASRAPSSMNEEMIEELYQEFMKIKGETTMNEQAVTIEQTTDYITIPISEYRFLISEQVTLSKLEGYAETHEYLSEEVIRALLGVEKPAASLESEGD